MNPEADAVMLITHAAKSGTPFEDYLKSVARTARVKVAKLGIELKNFESKEEIK